MINRTELEKRDFRSVMDLKAFLTSRTSTAMDGTTQHIFIGYAYPGRSEDDPVWMIQRVAIFANESTATLFADGQTRFNQVWSNHASLTYS